MAAVYATNKHPLETQQPRPIASFPTAWLIIINVKLSQNQIFYC